MIIQNYDYEPETSYTLNLFIYFFIFSLLCSCCVTDLIKKLDYVYWLLLFLIITMKFGPIQISVP